MLIHVHTAVHAFMCEVNDRYPAALALVRKTVPLQFSGEVADAVLNGVRTVAKQLGEEVAALSSGGP